MAASHPWTCCHRDNHGVRRAMATLTDAGPGRRVCSVPVGADALSVAIGKHADVLRSATVAQGVQNRHLEVDGVKGGRQVVTGNDVLGHPGREGEGIANVGGLDVHEQCIPLVDATVLAKDAQGLADLCAGPAATRGMFICGGAVILCYFECITTCSLDWVSSSVMLFFFCVDEERRREGRDKVEEDESGRVAARTDRADDMASDVSRKFVAVLEKRACCLLELNVRDVTPQFLNRLLCMNEALLRCANALLLRGRVGHCHRVLRLVHRYAEYLAAFEGESVDADASLSVVGE